MIMFYFLKLFNSFNKLTICYTKQGEYINFDILFLDNSLDLLSSCIIYFPFLATELSFTMIAGIKGCKGQAIINFNGSFNSSHTERSPGSQ